MGTSTTGTSSVRHALFGAAVALGLMAALGALMFALRSHIGDATVALILLVPVVIGVVLGGTRAGLAVAVAGFLLYDFVFILPYYTLTVGSPRNWEALVAYLAVVPLLARVVSRLRSAEDAAREREADTIRLLELSQLLIEDRPLDELLSFAVSIVGEAFGCEAVVLLLPEGDRLELAASAGRGLSDEELRRVTPAPGVLGTAGAGSATWPAGPALRGPTGLGDMGRKQAETTEAENAAIDTETVVLASPTHPVGLLILLGTRFTAHQRLLVAGFANHLAIAVERAQLQEQALRAQVLEEVDRLRRALVGAVSHDLRTPLATIKASVSTLLDSGVAVSEAEREELLTLVEEQADRLARLVTNLLDMSRIEAGALAVERQPLDVRDLAMAAVRSVRPSLTGGRSVVVRVPASLPAVDADHVLVEQVLVNLLENALRHAPESSEVVVDARAAPAGVMADARDSAPAGVVADARAAPCGMLEVSVSDRGPGIAEEERLRLFEPGRWSRGGAGSGAAAGAAAGAGSGARRAGPPSRPGGGSGLGLTIAKAFVEALGGRISAGGVEGGGARVWFLLPVASEARVDGSDGGDGPAAGRGGPGPGGSDGNDGPATRASRPQPVV